MFGRRGERAADPARFAELVRVEECPRASAWDPVWVWSHQMGPTNLWLAELLAERMSLQSGMRVLDMGCGSAATSMFLAMEYGVDVVAADLWIDPTDNLARIRDAGLERRVLPMRVEAETLPFAEGWFDASFCIDAYHYFGMGEDYLRRYAAVVRPGGQIGVVVPGDRDDTGTWESFRSSSWWQSLWERSGVVEGVLADEIPGGRDLWLRFLEVSAAWTGSGDVHAEPDAELLFSEKGGSLGFTRIVATRRN